MPSPIRSCSRNGCRPNLNPRIGRQHKLLQNPYPIKPGSLQDMLLRKLGNLFAQHWSRLQFQVLLLFLYSQKIRQKPRRPYKICSRRTYGIHHNFRLRRLLPKEYNRMLGKFINTPRQTHLDVFLLDIILIDTECINPSERRVQVSTRNRSPSPKHA